MSHNSASKDKVVVLITGCSTGIGKSTALTFASQGSFFVYATMRNTAKWDMPEQDNLVIAEMDVTSDESVSALVSLIISEQGCIDIVINNAGYGMTGCLESVSIEDAKQVFDVNVWGVVRVLQAVLPHMRKQKSGHAIQISSTSGVRGVPCFEYYTGSKFALEGITDSMRYSLAPYNISVTNINPGPVKTSFADKCANAEQGGRGTRVPENNDGYFATYEQRMLDGLTARMNSAEVQTSQEVAELILSVAALKLKPHAIQDISFNVGTSKDSQALLDQLRRYPTGWGGMYDGLLASAPPLPAEPIDR